MAEAPWSDCQLLERIQFLVDAAMGEGRRYWLVDDSCMPKKGQHSVGVTRQYCGQIGTQDNCQATVNVSLATQAASAPIDFRLYLLKLWAEDTQLRAGVGVPKHIDFATKPAFALGQTQAAVERGTNGGTVVADAGHGMDGAFREGLEALGFVYSVGMGPTTSVWLPGAGPLPPKRRLGRGRMPKNMQLAPGHEPVSVEALACSLPAQKWSAVCWRQGTNTELSGRLTRVRVCVPSGDHARTERRSEQWLLIELSGDEPEATKYFLLNEPASATLGELVTTAKIRWRIERDYQGLKSEFGLNHYEGRSWRGFHHHARLCIACTHSLPLTNCVTECKKNQPRPSASGLPERLPTTRLGRSADSVMHLNRWLRCAGRLHKQSPRRCHAVPVALGGRKAHP